MGRPAGSKNKPKNVEASGDVEPEKIVLTDEELWSLTARHVKEFEDAKEAQRIAAQAKRDADEHYKVVVKLAEQEGVPLADIKAWVEAQTAEGQSKMKDAADRLARMSRWFNFKLGHQPDIFDESPAPVTNRSHRLGYEAGLAGDQPKPPQDCDINAWMAAWQKGQADKISGGIKKMDEAA